MSLAVAFLTLVGVPFLFGWVLAKEPHPKNCLGEEIMGATGKTFALRALAIAQGYVGEDRANNREQISRFLGLFGLPFADPATGALTPFCAAGVCYAFAKAYCQVNAIAVPEDNPIPTLRGVLPDIVKGFFLPDPRCHILVEDAERRGTWLTNAASDLVEIQPGWLVVYAFGADGKPDHVGIVENATDLLHTVEFNTSGPNDVDGGAVERQTRSYDAVLGFVRLY